MELTNAFIDALTNPWDRVLAFLPSFVAGIAILLVGYFVSRLLAGFVERLMRQLGLNAAGDRAGIESMLRTSGIGMAPSELIGRTVFLFSMLIFIVTAAGSLGLDAISSTIDAFILFLPKVVAAVLIALLGMYAAQLLRDAVVRMTESLSVEYASALGSAAYGLCILVIGTLAVSQLGVDTDLLQMLIAVVLGVCGLGAAIALGFGTQVVAQNVVSGVYVRDMLEPGAFIRWHEHDGKILEVGAVTTIIEYADGRRLHLPNHSLVSEPFEITSPE